MSSFKLVCVTAVAAASLIAGSAFADCSRSQEIALAQATTRAIADKGGAQHQKQITLHDCDATSDGAVNSAFTYHYYDDQGLQTVKGTVTSEKGRVTSLDTGKDHAVASRDDHFDYEDSTLGRYSF